jgi:hypothetical protein
LGGETPFLWLGVCGSGKRGVLGDYQGGGLKRFEEAFAAIGAVWVVPGKGKNRGESGVVGYHKTMI